LINLHRPPPPRSRKANVTAVVVQWNERAAQAAQIITTLAERFPAAFAIYARRRKPLKIGVFDDLLAATAGSIPPAELKDALRAYCRSYGYFRACREGIARVDLAGQPAGAVTAAEAARAAVCADRQLQRWQQKKAAAAPPAPAAPLAPAPAPAAAPKRLSLADLKVAAAARRAAS